MDFTTMLQEVLRITKRPDKGQEAAAAINRAVSYCTFKGRFRRDLVEASIPIDATTYGGTVDISTLTRFRIFNAVKPTGTRYYLTPIAEDQIFTTKGQIQPNRYYIAGTSMTYTLGATTSALEVSYFTHAPRLDATIQPSYWMLDYMPDAITDLACARVFADIGNDIDAARYEKSGMDLFKMVLGDLAEGD